MAQTIEVVTSYSGLYDVKQINALPNFAQL